MEKIMIVDDELPVIELIEAKLKSIGYATVTATNGREALETTPAEMPDLVLLDILLPEIDGFEVCRRLKADPATTTIPIIFLSGKLLERDVVKGLELGAEDYIIKPFSPRELAARVKHQLGERKADKTGPPSYTVAHLEQKIEALSALHNVSAAMNAMRDLNELRQYILEQALEVAGAKAGSLMILDEQRLLRIVNAKGLPDKIIRQTRIKPGEGISGSVASIGEPLLVTNIEEDARFRRPSGARYETRSLVCVPLKVRDKTIGVLNVNNKKSGEVFNQDDLEILTLLANQAAVATENANLYERMNANLAEYATLKTAIDSALKGHSLTEMIKEMLKQAVAMTGGTVGVLFLADETTGELYVANAEGTVADRLNTVRIAVGQGAIGQAARLKKELSLEDGGRREEPLGRFRNMIGQPLAADGTLLGYIVVGDKTKEDRFTPEDLSALKSLADEAVFVLHISRAASVPVATGKNEPTTGHTAGPEKMREFCSSVAHELREPLTSIRGFSELLIDRFREPDNDARHYLEVINSEASRMSKLIDDLLHISKLEAGLAKLDLRPASLPEAIDETLETMAQLSDYRVEVEVPDDLSPAILDRNKFSQILINLLGNAAAYSKPGQPIKIAVKEEPDRFIISVSDKGSGIAPQDQKHVFDKFFRADTPENKEIAGTGLGLAIVKHLVSQQGGTVKVESSPGRGSKFWFTLPKGMTQYV